MYTFVCFYIDIYILIFIYSICLLLSPPKIQPFWWRYTLSASILAYISVNWVIRLLVLDECSLGMLCGQDPGSQHNLDTLNIFSSMMYILLLPPPPRVIRSLGRESECWTEWSVWRAAVRHLEPWKSLNNRSLFSGDTYREQNTLQKTTYTCLVEYLLQYLVDEPKEYLLDYLIEYSILVTR